MAMRLSLTNIFQFISSLAPLLLGFYLVLNSIIEQNIKGLVYLAGAVLASIVNILLMNFIESPKSIDASPICNLVEIPFAGSTLNLYNSPAINSTFLGFTTSYLYIPMAEKGILNYALMSCLLIIFVIDAISQVSNKCTTYVGVTFGGLLGLLLGYGWYSVISRTSKDLVFLSTSAGKELVCNRLKRQKLRCQIKQYIKGRETPTSRELGQAIMFDENSNLVVDRNIKFTKKATMNNDVNIHADLNTHDINIDPGKKITTDGTTLNKLKASFAEGAGHASNMTENNFKTRDGRGELRYEPNTNTWKAFPAKDGSESEVFNKPEPIIIV